MIKLPELFAELQNTWRPKVCYENNKSILKQSFSVLDDYPYSFPVDWWSLGIVLHEMIVGKLPWPTWSSHDELYQRICNERVPPLPNRVGTPS